MQKYCDMSTTDPTFAHITRLFYFYLFADEGPRQTSKTKVFLQQQNGNQGLFYPLIDKSTMSFLRNEIPCYLLKSPKTHAILGEYRVLSTVSLEKLRMKLHNYALLTSFLELALLSLLIKINISNYLKFISVIWRI